MLSNESRKEAIRRFKEQKPTIGIYAIRSTTTGHTWVGTSRNLQASKNSSWFQLRGGLHKEKALQEEWVVQGEASFQFEILDRLDEDVHPLQIPDQLKLKKNDWTVRLGAQQLL
jgi:hypothetical protein